MSYPERATLQSSDPRKMWELSIYKPQGRPAYATAIEGEVDYSNGYRVFRFMLDPTKLSRAATKVAINGPATKKKREAAIAALEVQLREAGLLAKPDALAGECAALQHFADVAAGYAEF